MLRLGSRMRSTDAKRRARRRCIRTSCRQRQTTSRHDVAPQNNCWTSTYHGDLVVPATDLTFTFDSASSTSPSPTRRRISSLMPTQMRPRYTREPLSLSMNTIGLHTQCTAHGHKQQSIPTRPPNHQMQGACTDKVNMCVSRFARSRNTIRAARGNLA